MRAKHILNLLPLGTKVRLVYDRFTVTPVATVFVFVALAHCIAQISLQAIAYSANTAAGQTISQIFRESNVSSSYAVVEDGMLKICDDPMNMSACQSVTTAAANVGADFRAPPIDPPPPSLHRRDLNLSEISVQCIEALNWPQMILHDARREDICFLVFQVWLLGISVVTILNESIPHLVTALISHAMSSTWGVFQVSRTLKYGGLYRSLVVKDACGGINVLSGFWAKRLNYFIPILVLNAVAFIVSSIVSYRLFTVFAHRTFKRVGYSDKMNVLYSYILSFSVALQLSAFFIICSSALWLDSLFNGVLAKYTADKTANRIIFIHVCAWTLPWICIGWTSVRREHRLWMSTFFLIGFFLLGAWISAFPTSLYKKKFHYFPFFAAISVTSFALLTITLLLAAFCRLNFGKGLPQYLKRQDLIDESSFVPVFLTRNRQSTLHSVVFPDKRIRHTTSHSQIDKQPSNLLPSDPPPSYGIQAPYVKPPGRTYAPESDRKSPRQQRARRYCLLSLTKSRIGSADLSAIAEEGHSVSRPLNALQADEITQSKHSSRVADPYGSLLNAWTACKGILDAKSQSRASTPLPLWCGQRLSSSASIPLSYKTIAEGKESTQASCHNERPHPSLSASTPPLRFASRPNQSPPRSSASLSTQSSQQQKLRVGLPPSPDCLKTWTSG